MNEKFTGWSLIDGNFIYKLNENGTNYFSCQVQGGHNNEGLRTSKEEIEAIATFIHSAPDMAAEIDRLRAALTVLKDWPLRSLCFDGSRAQNAAESLANARRFAGEAIQKGKEEEVKP